MFSTRHLLRWIASLTTSDLALGGLPVKFVKRDPTKEDPWPFNNKEDVRMIRAVHTPLWKRVRIIIADSKKKKIRNGLYIRGNPGLGKTMTLDTLCSLSLTEDPNVPVLAVTSKGCTLYFNGGGTSKKSEQVTYAELGQASAAPVIAAVHLIKKKVKLNPGPLLVLHDIKSRYLQYNDALDLTLDDLGFYGTTIIACSSNKENWHEFNKRVPGSRKAFIWPVLEELEALEFQKTLFPNRSKVLREEYYYDVGGVPRHLALDDTAEVLESQDEAAPTLKYSPLLVIAQTEVKEEESSKLVQAIPDPDYVGVHAYSFISKRAEACWYSYKGLRDLDAAMKEFAKCDQGKRALAGHIFENFILEKLKNQDSANLFRSGLDATGTSAGRPQEWKAAQLASRQVTLGATGSWIPKITEHPSLIIPSVGNFCVADALLTMGKRDVNGKFPVAAVQVTVAVDHKTKPRMFDKFTKMVEAAGGNLKEITFVVDSMSDLNKRQGGHGSVPQYLCRVMHDAGMVWVQGTAWKRPVAIPKALNPLTEIQRFDPKATIITRRGAGTQNDPITFR